jgi:hypothetical protein
MRQQLQALMAQTQASEGEASELAQQLLEHARGSPLATELRAVSNALEQYDFDKAESLLTQALQSLEALAPARAQRVA